MITQKPKRRGPAPTGQGKLQGVRLHDDLLDALDRFRADQADDPSRPEAIRRMISDRLRDRGYLAK